MKKTFAMLALIAVLMLSMVGCGLDDGNVPENSTPASETTEAVGTQPNNQKDYVDADGNVYHSMNEDELLLFVDEQLNHGADNYKKFEEPYYVKLTLRRAKINDKAQTDYAYHYGTKKIKPSANTSVNEGLQYLLADVTVYSEKFGYDYVSVVSQEKFEQLKDTIKAIADGEDLVVVGTIKEITCSTVGGDASKLAYDCQVVITDVLSK